MVKYGVRHGDEFFFFVANTTVPIMLVKATNEISSMTKERSYFYLLATIIQEELKESEKRYDSINGNASKFVRSGVFPVL